MRYQTIAFPLNPLLEGRRRLNSFLRFRCNRCFGREEDKKQRLFARAHENKLAACIQLVYFAANERATMGLDMADSNA